GETVREPTMLTLALTWTVPLTEEPGAGDVMVAIRLPPGSGGSICANAWGVIQAKPKTINRAAAQTFLFVFFSVERASIRPASLSNPRAARFATYRSLSKTISLVHGMTSNASIRIQKSVET